MVENARSAALLRVLRVSAAAAALFPLHAGSARAAPNALDNGTVSLGAGLFFGYQWNSHTNAAGFEWGLEAFLTRRLRTVGECSSEPRAGIGPLLQIGILGTHDPRITVAAQGGGEVERGFALSGELGLTYRFGREPGFGVHIGVVPELLLFNVALRYQALRNEAWVGGGLRYLPTYGSPGMCVEGRPLRGARGERLVHDAAERHAPTRAGAAQLAAAGFAHAAQLECDSVAAFLQLALELYAVGAPASLVDAAVAAAHDEIRHTRQCAALADRTCRHDVRPVMPTFTARHAPDADTALVRLATESWYDGCLAEAAAAREAAWAADACDDRSTAAALRAIARDEATHRELAWAVLDFCLARGGETVRRALRDAAETPATSDEDEQQHPSGLERYGRLSSRSLARLASEQRHISQTRLAARGVLAGH